MQSHLPALAIVAALAAGCVSNETKPESASAPAAASSAPAAAAGTIAAPAPVAAKPECPPEATGKKKPTAKSKTRKGGTTAADCEPAKPKGAAPVAPAKAEEPPAPAPTPAKEDAKAAEAGKPRIVKSRDGTFDGEVYGNIPANSKWAKLQIGMHQSEVERILGATSNIRGYVTAKAWIPFYFGTDSHRYEAVYAGQGSVAYTGGGMGGGQGVLMMINYDPKIQ